MRTGFKIVIAGIVIASIVLLLIPSFAPQSDPRRQFAGVDRILAESHQRFAIDLYRELAKEKSNNILFSPFSVHSTLSLAAHGANGQTRKELADALYLPPDRNEGLTAVGNLMRYYSGIRGACQVNSANGIWGQRNLGFRANYINDVSRFANDGFQEVDFADPAHARQTINQWISDQTQNRIADLIGPDDFDHRTRLVLVNAIAFQGLWQTQFDTKRTGPGTFHCADGTTVTTQFMSAKKCPCRIAIQNDRIMLELPYKSDDLALLVIMPEEGIELEVLEKQLTDESLRQWMQQMSDSENEEFRIPKFQIQQRLSLKEPLTSLGIRAAFSENEADFSGMHESEPLFIDRVLHQSYVELNEDGTEAVSATVAPMAKKAERKPGDPIEFNRPFLYCIRDTRNGTILFMGRLANPSE